MNKSSKGFWLRVFVYLLIAGFLSRSISAAGAQQLTSIDSLKNAVFVANQDTIKVKAFVELSKAYKNLNHDSAIIFADEALQLSKSIDFRSGCAIASIALGDAEVSIDSIDKAKTFYLDAINYYQSANDELKLPKLYLILGSLYTYQNDLFEALDCFQKALNIAEKHDLKVTQEQVLNNLGTIYKTMEKYDEALDCFNRALVICKELEYREEVYYIYGNLGILHATMGDKKLAETFFKKTLQIAREKKDEVIEAFALVSLGDFNMDIKEYQEALNYYNHALELGSVVSANYNGPKSLFFANVYSGIGSAHYALKDYDSAIIYLSMGFEKANETGQLTIVAESADKLSRAYESRNQYKVSLKYARIHQQAADSAMNNDIVRRVTELDMQNKFDKVIAEREFQQALNEATQKRNQVIYLMVIGGAVSGLIIFLLLFLLQKSKMNRERLSSKNLELEKENLTNDLAYKNKELTTNVMYLLRKNELILNVTDKLKKAKMDFKIENRKVIEEVIRDMENASKGDIWKEFELRFQEVHIDFYNTLIEMFPLLSPNELKLCAFLRLNMSTKDIAAVTFLSINSINVARHRLRKKLNIDQDENLIIFLSNL